MKPTTLKRHALLASALFLFGITEAAALSIPQAGTLNVTILDENGAMVAHAPVYIYGEAKTKFVGGKEIPGTATLNIPAGTYRISSALMRKTGVYYDRFASREAHVEIVAGDNTVVTLHLRALEDMVNAAAEETVSMLGPDGGEQLAKKF